MNENSEEEKCKVWQLEVLCSLLVAIRGLLYLLVPQRRLKKFIVILLPITWANNIDEAVENEVKPKNKLFSRQDLTV